MADEDDDKNSNDVIAREINGVKIYLNELMENISETILRNIENSFIEKGVRGKLNERELHDVLKLYNIIIPKKDFSPFFNKIDVNKNGTADFLQFMVYLSFEFELKRTENKLTEERLSKLSFKLLPNQIIRDENKQTFNINCIALKSEKNRQDETDIDKSEYVATTEKGELVFYSSDLKWKNTYSLRDYSKVILL